MPKIEGCYFGDRDISKVIYQNKVIYKKTYESLLKLTKNFLIIKENKISGIKNIFQRKIKKGDRTEIVLESYTKQELKELTPFLNDIAKKKEKIVFNLDIGEFSEDSVELYDANGLILSEVDNINSNHDILSKYPNLEELKMPMLKYVNSEETIFGENKIKTLDLGKVDTRDLERFNCFPSLETLILRGGLYGSDDINLSYFKVSKKLKEIYLPNATKLELSFIDNEIFPEKIIANNVTVMVEPPCNTSKLKHIELNALKVGANILINNNTIESIRLPELIAQGGLLMGLDFTWTLLLGVFREIEINDVAANYIVDCFKKIGAVLDVEKLKRPRENNSYLSDFFGEYNDVDFTIVGNFFYQGIYTKKEIKDSFEGIPSVMDDRIMKEGLFSGCNNLKDIYLSKLKTNFPFITKDCPNLKNIYLESCEELDIDKSFVNSGKPTIHISRKCKILSNNIGAKIEYID